MKKNIIKVALVAVVGLIAGINVFKAQKAEVLSDVAMANVEALANNENNNGGSSNSWDCWSQQKPGYGYYRCGNPCVWVENFSGEGSSSKCFK